MTKKLTNNWLEIDWKYVKKASVKTLLKKRGYEDFVKWIKSTTSSLNIWLKNWLKID